MPGERFNPDEVSTVRKIILNEMQWPTAISAHDISFLRGQHAARVPLVGAISELIFIQGRGFMGFGLDSIPDEYSQGIKGVALNAYSMYLRPSHAVWAGDSIVREGKLNNHFLNEKLLERTSVEAQAVLVAPELLPQMEGEVALQKEEWIESAEEVARMLKSGIDPVEASEIYTVGQIKRLKDKEPWIADMEALVLFKGHKRFKQLHVLAAAALDRPEESEINDPKKFETADAAEKFLRGLE